MSSILFVDHATGIGGAEMSLLLLMSQLQQRGRPLALAGQPGTFLETAAAQNIPIFPLPMPTIRGRSALNSWLDGIGPLRHVIRQISPLCVYANTVRAAFYAAPAARLSRRPFVWHMRDFWLSENKPARTGVDRLLKIGLQSLATITIANSQTTANHLPLTRRVHVVPNGIDLQDYDPQRPSQFRARFAIPPDAPLVGMAGRLRPWKGQRRFVELAALLAPDFPQAHFAIVGGNPLGNDDAYVSELHQLAAIHGLTGRLHLTGQITPLAEALAAFDLFIHPGDPEPFGLVNIEALAMERPVVAFAHGALPEIIQDGKTGFLVPPHDLAAMASRVSDLLTNQKLAQSMGRQGRAHVERYFSIDRVAADIDAILQNIAGHDPANPPLRS